MFRGYDADEQDYGKVSSPGFQFFRSRQEETEIALNEFGNTGNRTDAAKKTPNEKEEKKHYRMENPPEQTVEWLRYGTFSHWKQKQEEQKKSDNNRVADAREVWLAAYPLKPSTCSDIELEEVGFLIRVVDNLIRNNFFSSREKHGKFNGSPQAGNVFPAQSKIGET